MFAGDELAQVVSCPWIMRDSGGSLAQNHWQGDLGLPAGRQDNAGGGIYVYSIYMQRNQTTIALIQKYLMIAKNNALQTQDLCPCGYKTC